MSARITVIPGQHFDGGIVDPIPRPAPADAPKRELIDEYMAVLWKLDPDTPELQRLRDVLIGRRIELNKESLKLIESERVKANTALRAEWEQAKALCREQLVRIDELKAERAEAIREWNKANENKSHAEMKEWEAVERRKGLSPFASAAQIAKADDAVEKSHQAFVQSGKLEAQHRGRMNTLTLSEIPAAQRKLDELAAQEKKLRHGVTGEGYTTELGIVVRAHRPL
jgi:hypothetical protein